VSLLTRQSAAKNYVAADSTISGDGGIIFGFHFCWVFTFPHQTKLVNTKINYFNNWNLCQPAIFSLYRSNPITFSSSLKPRTEKLEKSSFGPKLIFLGILKIGVSKFIIQKVWGLQWMFHNKFEKSLIASAFFTLIFYLLISSFCSKLT
jgi:hypothetical protein